MITESGKFIPLLNQLKLMSSDQWEEFILEWITTRSDLYVSYDKLAGTGDKGRDIIGYIDDPKNKTDYTWDNYQCKYYKGPLKPTDIWVEIAKICYFSYINDYAYPNKYYFVSPMGIGTKLIDYLNNPNKLRTELFKNWARYCETEITSKQKIPLDKKLTTYIESKDFGIFDKINPIQLIIDHSKTQFHHARFSTPLAARPKSPLPTNNILANEIIYVGKLIRAYDSDANKEIKNIDDLSDTPHYMRHLKRSREAFCEAECLRNFSRDNSAHETFEKIQNEIHSGIIDIIEDGSLNGFNKVKTAVQEARRLQLSQSALSSYVTTNDRNGICHQLANDDKIDWCDNE